MSEPVDTELEGMINGDEGTVEDGVESSEIEDKTVNEQDENTENIAVEDKKDEDTKDDGSLEDTEDEGESIEDAFKPTFKYKVKGEEREFDDIVKGVIKTKEQEEHFRDLYSKADGLEHIKEHKDRLQTEVNEYKPKAEEYDKIVAEYTNMRTSVTDAATLIKNGDIVGGLSRMGITPELILEASNIINAPEEQKSINDYTSKLAQEKLRQEKEIASRDTEIKQREQMVFNQAVNNLKAQLDLEMARPEYSSIAEIYNERLGDPNAFFNEVKREGEMYAFTNNNAFLSPADAVKAAANRISKVIGEVVQTGTQQQKTSKTNTDKIVSPTKGTGIPNAKSAGSAGKKRYADADELMAEVLAEEELNG